MKQKKYINVKIVMVILIKKEDAVDHLSSESQSLSAI